jgi:hypothetical protein
MPNTINPTSLPLTLKLNLNDFTRVHSLASIVSASNEHTPHVHVEDKSLPEEQKMLEPNDLNRRCWSGESLKCTDIHNYCTILTLGLSQVTAMKNGHF